MNQPSLKLAKVIYYSIEGIKRLSIIVYLLFSGTWIHYFKIRCLIQGKHDDGDEYLIGFASIMLSIFGYIFVPIAMSLGWPLIITIIITGYAVQLGLFLYINIFKLIENSYDIVNKEKNL